MPSIYFDQSKPKDRLRKKTLVVEGIDDAYFADRILAFEQASADEVGIVILGGIGNLTANLRDLVKSRLYVTREIQDVAVLRDADYDPAASLTDLTTALTANELPFQALGNFVEYDGGRHAGAYMLPSDGTEGNLESVLLEAVADDPRRQWVTELFERVQGVHGVLDRRHKRLMQLYLACLPVDCRGPGRAYHLQALPTNEVVLDPLRGFIRAFLGL